LKRVASRINAILIASVVILVGGVAAAGWFVAGIGAAIFMAVLVALGGIPMAWVMRDRSADDRRAAANRAEATLGAMGKAESGGWNLRRRRR
jgi:hypothetical protein